MHSYTGHGYETVFEFDLVRALATRHNFLKIGFVLL